MSYTDNKYLEIIATNTAGGGGGGSSTVSVSNFPAVQPINDNGGSITVDGIVSVNSFPSSQNVVVTSIPEVEIKNDVSNPIPVSGTVSTNNVISSTVGFSSVRYIFSLATTNATLVKNSSTVIDSISLYTTVTNTTTAYLKLYNKATTPIPGTDVPFAVFKINVNQGAVINFNKGLLLNQGLGFAITRGASPIDTGVIGIGEITGNIVYA